MIEGRTLNCKAARIDNSLYNQVSYETYDCGLPDTVDNRKKAGIAIPTPQQEDAAKNEIEAALNERKLAAQKALDDQRRAAAEKAEAAKKAVQARVLKSNQDLADKGDAYGLLRMGERYRDGEGVPKDLAKAKDYLTKAAAAGSTTAADELSKLNQTPSNSSATQ